MQRPPLHLFAKKCRSSSSLVLSAGKNGCINLNLALTLVHLKNDVAPFYSLVGIVLRDGGRAGGDPSPCHLDDMVDGPCGVDAAPSILPNLHPLSAFTSFYFFRTAKFF